MNPMRTLLLGMADSPICKRLLTGWGVTRRVVKRFVPGETLDEAAAAVAQVNAEGLTATMNPLGENVANEATATASTNAYIEILDRIAADGLGSNISVKLTMLGLDLGHDIAIANLRRVLQAAERHDNFVRIDMEASPYVESTLEIFRELRADHPKVGAVIQTYLRRSGDDIEALISEGASVRVVKGAYNEPPEVAFPDKADVDRNFVAILDRLARADARENGVRVAIGSHDPAILAKGSELIESQGIEAGWEFQMLYGIGKQHQRELAAAGHDVRIYVSYGVAWYPWFMRRLAERPANVLFFLRHLFG